MQRLIELLPKWKEKNKRNSSQIPPPVEPQYNCPRCEDFGWVYADVSRDDPMYGQAVPCDCGIASRGMIERLRRWAELPEGTERLTFANFSLMGKGNDIKRAFHTAKSFAERKADECWLTFLGPPGVGKTHLAIAVIRHRLEILDPTDPQGYGKYVFVPDFLDELRATFRDEAQESYDSVFGAYKEAPLLVLDDLGAETPTPWVNEKLDQLLDWRYIRQKETVITLNYGLERLGERIADRIADTREGRSILLVMSGGSHRRILKT